MSASSSPTRSKVSSRQSTPTVVQLDTYELTPRSKVKALLATIDSDSETDGSKSDESYHQKSSSLKRVQNIPTGDLGEPRLSKSTLNKDDESEEEPVRPRGRLVSRLYSHKPTGSNEIHKYPGHIDEYTPASPIDSNSRADDPNLEGRASSASSEFNDSPRDLHHKHPSKSPPLKTIASQRSSLNPFPVLKPVGKYTSGGSRCGNESDSDLPREPQMSNRLQLLVARKQKQREAKEAAEAQKLSGERSHQRHRSRSKPNHFSSAASNASDNQSDDDIVETKLTQQVRPTRKASKRAIEEMNRETQRLSRNMQLAHQAKIKKKFTKASLLERFNFQGNQTMIEEHERMLSSSALASSAQASDADDAKEKETPPTSPIEPVDQQQKPPASLILLERDVGDGVSVTAENIKQTLPHERPVPLSEVHQNHRQPSDKRRAIITNAIHGVHFPVAPQRKKRSYDSGSDLEIVSSPRPKRSKLDIFIHQRARGINDRSPLKALRAFARINSSSEHYPSAKPSMTMSAMQSLLQKQARRQAAEERAEKLQDLKNRGVLVQSVEEREKDQAEIENLLEKARNEDAELAKKERKKAKDGEVQDRKIESEDEDEDYSSSEATGSDLDLSGSEDRYGKQEPRELEHSDFSDDSDNDSGEGVVLDCIPEPHQFFDEEASEHSEEREEKNHEVEGTESAATELHSQEQKIGNETCIPEHPNSMRPLRNVRRNHIIYDDEDEEDNAASVKESPNIATDDIIEKPAIPGLPFFNALPIGLTQAFAATMADSQIGTDQVDRSKGQVSLNPFEVMPEPKFSAYNLADSQQVVLDSQKLKGLDNAKTQENRDLNQINPGFPQFQPTNGSLSDNLDALISTQCSEIPDPTQDVGFVLSSPISNRFVSVPPSTVDTVLLSGARNTPVAKKKGRLRRGREIPADILRRDDDNYKQLVRRSQKPSKVDAFSAFKNAAQKSQATLRVFDKGKSEAKTMVEEQAQESEDEYAGLGGASDEDTAEEDEEIQEMIEEGEVDVDESELAALHANKERASDEKAVEKLFRDLNTGGLRRKRGVDFDLSESDDDVEARRRAKRREFAKMRKALLENDKVGKLAEDPKKSAFLRAIEDREYDERLELFEEPQRTSVHLNTIIQDNTESQTQPVTSTASAVQSRHKQPLQDTFPDNASNLSWRSRLSTHINKKPATLAEIRNSVSFLIEEPNADFLDANPISSPHASDDENNIADKSRNPFASRRRPNQVVDRLSLKRAESTATATTTKSAFVAPASAVSSEFKVPSLLRRATTSALALTDTGPNLPGGSLAVAGTERAAGGGSEGTRLGIKKGGSRKSSIGYFARERDRRKGLDEGERRRREGMLKLMRESSSGLRGLATGAFD